MSAFVLNAIQHGPAPEPKTQERDLANQRGQAKAEKDFNDEMRRVLEKLGDQNRGITDAAARKHRQERHQPERAPGALFVPLGAEHSFLQLRPTLGAPVEDERSQKLCLFFSLAHSSFGRAFAVLAGSIPR